MKTSATCMGRRCSRPAAWAWEWKNYCRQEFVTTPQVNRKKRGWRQEVVVQYQGEKVGRVAEKTTIVAEEAAVKHMSAVMQANGRGVVSVEPWCSKSGVLWRRANHTTSYQIMPNHTGKFKRWCRALTDGEALSAVSPTYLGNTSTYSTYR